MDALANIVEESGKFQANDLDSEENAEARNLLLKFKTGKKFWYMLYLC